MILHINKTLLGVTTNLSIYLLVEGIFNTFYTHRSLRHEGRYEWSKIFKFCQPVVVLICIVTIVFWALFSPNRIYFGAMWGPWNAPVRPEKRIQLRHRRHFDFFLQFGLSPRGSARADLSGRRATNVECSFTAMCWYVLVYVCVKQKIVKIKVNQIIWLGWLLTRLWPVLLFCLIFCSDSMIHFRFYGFYCFSTLSHT